MTFQERLAKARADVAARVATLPLCAGCGRPFEQPAWEVPSDRCRPCNFVLAADRIVAALKGDR